MRRFVCLATLALLAHSAAGQAATDDGRIPITTHNVAAASALLEGRALVELLKNHDAYFAFQRAVALDSSFALGEYYLATTAPTPKELAAHLQRAKALSDGASVGERLLILGLEARSHADRARALAIAESLVVLYPRDARAHSGLAAQYSLRQQYAKTIAEYRTAIQLDPAYSIGYNQLGYAYRAVGNLAAAESTFKRYTALVPNDPNPYDSYAELLMKTGRFDESIVQYRKALANDSTFNGSYVGIAADHMLAGRYVDAIAELEDFFARGRDDFQRREALINEAMVHVDHGSTDAAIMAILKAQAIARAAGDVANVAADDATIGDIFFEAGRVDAAAEQYARAHEAIAASDLSTAVKEDDRLGALYESARIAITRHALDAARMEATAYLNGALAKRNDARVRQAHEVMGEVAIASRDFTTALSELAQADQENPAVLYAMARAEAGKGDAAAAKRLTDQAMGMNILPTLPYVFTRASIAAATRSATSRSGHETPR